MHEQRGHRLSDHRRRAQRGQLRGEHGEGSSRRGPALTQVHPHRRPTARQRVVPRPVLPQAEDTRGHPQAAADHQRERSAIAVQGQGKALRRKSAVVPGAGEVFGGQEGLLAVHSLHHRAQELIYMHICLLHPKWCGCGLFIVGRAVPVRFIMMLSKRLPIDFIDNKELTLHSLSSH